MPTGTRLTLPTQALLNTSFPKETFGLPDVQPTQSCHELEPPFPPPVSHAATPSMQLQSSIDHDSDVNSVVPQSGEAEDEYTISAYGDISLSEVIVPPLPASTRSGSIPLRPKVSQPRLRLKVQRPPMPRRRLSYYVPDPLPHTGGLESGEDWPGSPRPIANISPWVQHQSLILSPLPDDPASSWMQENKPVKKNDSSLERLFEELLPHSPSIRLSPSGFPASQALDLPQGTHEQRSGVLRGRNPPEADDSAEMPQSSPSAPAPPQDKPKSKPWRTRLPPRLPIPKWDM